MSDYVLVVDVCHHEDYPCCGCSSEEYPMRKERAKEYESEGRIRILGDYDPITGTLRSEMSDYSDKVAEFVKFAKENPSLNMEYKSKDYSKFEDFVFDLIAGMDYDEVMALGDELSERDEVSRYIDDFYEIVNWQCDWSNDDFY